MSTTEQYKMMKINRPVRTCTTCKSRKVKCDKQQPCSNCVKKGLGDECAYLQNKFPSNISVFDSKTKIKYQSPVKSVEHKKPVRQDITREKPKQADSPDYISFRETENIPKKAISSEPQTQGPLSWKVLAAKDIALIIISEFTDYIKEEHKKGNNVEILKKLRLDKSTVICMNRERYKIKKEVSSPITSSTLTEKILNVLPEKRVITRMIEEYFKHFAPFVVYANEDEFKASIFDIVGPLGDINDRKHVDSLKLTRKNDLALVGMLLIMLRLGYLCVLSKVDSDPKESSNPLVQQITTTPIDLTTIEVAEECFKSFNPLAVQSLEVLQFALMIRVYQKFAPEFGEGLNGGESQFFIGVIVQIAHSIGLNRDPDTFMMDASPIQKNTRRRIWYSLMLTNLAEVYSFGSPFNLDSFYQDTKPPGYITNDGRIIEENTIFNELEELATELKGCLRMILSTESKTYLPTFIKRLDSLETFMDRFFDIKAEWVKSEEWCKLSISKVQIWVSMRVFFLTVHFHIYLHYEKFKDHEYLQWFFLKKILIFGVQDFLPYCSRLIRDGKTHFGHSANLILVPGLLQVIHRLALIIISVLVRLRFVEYGSKLPGSTGQNAEFNLMVSKVIRSFTTIFKEMHTIVKKFNTSYFYAWKIDTFMTRYMEVVVEDDSMYERYYPGAIGLRQLNMGYDQLADLHTTLEVAKTKLGLPIREFQQFAESPQSVSTIEASPTYTSDVRSETTPKPQLNAKDVDELLNNVIDDDSIMTGGNWCNFANFDDTNFDIFYTSTY